MLRPSSADRWWNCPGSEILSGLLPDGEETIYAKEGTFAHEYAANMIYDPANINDQRPEKPEWISEETFLEVITASDQYSDVIFGYMDATGLNYDDRTFFVEKKIDFPQLNKNHKPGIDCYFIDSKTVYIFDFKFGVGVVVDVNGNKQLLCYAAALVLDLRKQGIEVEEVVTVIVQPRKLYGTTVKEARYTVEDIYQFIYELMDKVDDIRKGDPTLSVGPWCRFCPALASCPESAKQMRRITELKSLYDAEKDNLDTVSEILKLRDDLAKYVKEIEAKAKHALQSGLTVKGYKLVKKSGIRKWADFYGLNIAIGGAPIQTREMVQKSPADIEKQLKKAKIQIDLTPYLADVPPTYALAKEGDEQPGVKGTALTDFEVYTD